jgi:predicted nucleic acid-binding protein
MYVLQDVKSNNTMQVAVGAKLECLETTDKHLYAERGFSEL